MGKQSWTAPWWVEGNLLILKFAIEGIKMSRRLPAAIWHAGVLEEELENEDGFRCTIPADLKNVYNRKVEDMRVRISAITPLDRPFVQTLVCMFYLRLACVVASYFQQPFALVCGMAMLQFVVAPYSFAISIGHCSMFIVVLYFGHCASWGLFELVRRTVLPSCLSVEFEVTVSTVAAFVIMDQVICFYVAFQPTDGAAPKRFPPLKLLTHVAYGFLNTKTYWLFVLLNLQGWKFNCTWILFEFCTGTGGRLNDWLSRRLLSWNVIFYTVHRAAHLPHVYAHAHKMHHYLHDSTSFDGHVYGSGMAEECFQAILDVLLGRAGIPPMFMSPEILKYSLKTKIDHQRKECEAERGVNLHADHHSYHRKNFGIDNAMLDIIFGTDSGEGENLFPVYPPSLITKTEKDGDIHFHVVADTKDARAALANSR